MSTTARQLPILEIYVNKEQYPDMYSLYKQHIETHNQVVLTTTYPNAGFDLFLPDQIVFNDGANSAFHSKLVNLQIKAQMFWNEQPAGYYLYLRSSIYKTPLMMSNHVGIIDCGYRGNLQCPLRFLPDEFHSSSYSNSHSHTPEYVIDQYTRIVQICHPTLQPILVKLLETENELSKTERGGRGFGSTGAIGNVKIPQNEV